METLNQVADQKQIPTGQAQTKKTTSIPDRPFRIKSGFPGLVQKTGGVLHSEATGVPQNGDNTFALGLDPGLVIEDWLEIEIIPLGSSITSASYVGLSTDKTQITINFGQSGTDQATVRAKIVHSLVR